VSRLSRPVVVVGDVGIDVLTRPLMPLVRGGEATSHISLVPGGAGGNTAAWLGAHDVDVSLLARVGNDQAGVAARGALEAAGVHCVFAVDNDLPTCVVVVLVDDAGERTMFSDRGANAAFRVEDVLLDDAAGAATGTGLPHLHLSGYVLFDTGSRAAGLAALVGARARGWTTSVDPQSAELVAEVGAAAFLAPRRGPAPAQRDRGRGAGRSRRRPRRGGPGCRHLRRQGGAVVQRRPRPSGARTARAVHRLDGRGRRLQRRAPRQLADQRRPAAGTARRGRGRQRRQPRDWVSGRGRSAKTVGRQGYTVRPSRTVYLSVELGQRGCGPRSSRRKKAVDSLLKSRKMT